jgi:hypothetical protein
MMQVRSLGRVAVDRWLRIARIPLDAAAHMFPDDRGPRNVALLAIDRADANVRAAAGSLLNDDSLRDEAARRRAAADERQRALALHARADEQRRQADALLAEDLARSEQLRDSAEREAEQRRRALAATTARENEQVERLAAERARAADAELAEKLAAGDTKAKRERLKVLDEQTAALDQQTDALTASDEAHRLAKAARDAEGARKGTA